MLLYYYFLLVCTCLHIHGISTEDSPPTLTAPGSPHTELTPRAIFRENSVTEVQLQTTVSWNVTEDFTLTTTDSENVYVPDIYTNESHKVHASLKLQTNYNPDSIHQDPHLTTIWNSDYTYSKVPNVNSDSRDSSQMTSLSENSDGPAVTLPSTKEETVPTWTKIFDSIQATCTAAGFVANLMTLITLARTPQGFSRLILILLRHQSLVDAWVCAQATALILPPPGWTTGHHDLDFIICHVWHSQAFYWGAVTLSTYNLVLVACERYLAIGHPFVHGRWSAMSKHKIAVWGMVLYVLCLFITHGCYIQTRYVEGECTYQYAFGGKVIDIYFFAFVIFTYITTYFLPAFTMATLYGLVARILHKRQSDDKLGRSKTIDRASAQLTKTAFTVTFIFIVSVGYDLHYYLLGYTGVTEYKLNTAVQKVGVFLSNLNSCANPFVYAVLMPIYRRNVVQTFCPGLRLESVKETSGEGNSETSLSPRSGVYVKGQSVNKDIDKGISKSLETLQSQI